MRHPLSPTNGEADMPQAAVHSNPIYPPAVHDNIPRSAKSLSATPEITNAPATTRLPEHPDRYGNGEGAIEVFWSNMVGAATDKPTKEGQKLAGKGGAADTAKDKPNSKGQNEAEQGGKGEQGDKAEQGDETEQDETEQGGEAKQDETKQGGEAKQDETKQRGEAEQGDKEEGEQGDEDEDGAEDGMIDMVKIKMEVVEEYHRMHTGSDEGDAENITCHSQEVQTYHGGIRT
jgi:hypothetical protein